MKKNANEITHEFSFLTHALCQTLTVACSCSTNIFCVLSTMFERTYSNARFSIRTNTSLV